MPETASLDESPILIRPARAEDRDRFEALVPRLRPAGPTVGRSVGAFDAWFGRLAAGEIDHGAGAETVAACDAEGVVLGFLTIRPDTEYFTDIPRAYVETLVVAREAEGRGVGRALMAWAETWARDRGLTVIALDVFAGNDRARAFYARGGYEDDFVRMVKTLEP